MLSKAEESEPYGWWHAKISMMRGDFAVVEYLGWDSKYSEIIPVDKIRHLNKRCACIVITVNSVGR